MIHFNFLFWGVNALNILNKGDWTMNMHLFETQEISWFKGIPTRRKINCFKLFFFKLRQDSKTILQCGNDFSRPIFSFVADGAPFPDIFVENQERWTVFLAWFDSFVIVDKIHHSILDSFLICCIIIAISKKMLFPFYSLCFWCRASTILSLKETSIATIVNKIAQWFRHVEVNDNWCCFSNVIQD